jgi:4-amino-4-deoxy-L-arabinose transferase-like glycosyltransferase
VKDAITESIRPSERFERFFPYLLILATAAVYLLPAAIGRAVLDDGDAFYAHAAQQMIGRSDWITPYANGVRFLDKPPLIYWVIAASYSIFGINEFALRFPTAISVLGTGWLLMVFGQLAGSKIGGFVAALVFICCAGTLFFTIEALPDIYLVLSLTLALHCFLRWYLDRTRPLFPLLGFFAALAVAVLAKSVIGAAFPLGIVFLFLLFSKDLPQIPVRHLAAGVLVFLVIALPWHILAAIRNPGFFQQYFINEQVMRFLGKRYPVDYVSVPRAAFWALLIAWLFPWSCFLPSIRWVPQNNEHMKATIRLMLCWAGLILTFFTVSARLEHYSFPALPPLAILIGLTLTAGIEHSIDERRDRSIARGFGALAMLGGLAAIAAIAVFVWFKMNGAGLLAGDSWTQRDKGYTNLFSPLFDLPAATRASLITPLLAALPTLALGLIGAWRLNARGKRLAAITVLSALMILFSWLALYSLHLCEGLLTSKNFAAALAKRYRPGDRLVVVGDYETANSINFYAPITIHLYQGMTASLDHGLRYPDAPKMILSSVDLNNLWQSKDRTFILAPPSSAAELGLDRNFEVMRFGGRVLLCNQPVVER